LYQKDFFGYTPLDLLYMNLRTTCNIYDMVKFGKQERISSREDSDDEDVKEIKELPLNANSVFESEGENSI
jgi:hypothetical protein